MLTEPQRIAESIVGVVAWQGVDGYCPCPGASKHTRPSSPLDLHVVTEPIPRAVPGCYCYHSSCAKEVAAASRRLRSALGRHTFTTPRVPSPITLPRRPTPPDFDPAKLARIAGKLFGINEDWFAKRSRTRVDIQTPASFLHALYQPGERIVIFDVFKSQGRQLWTHRGPQCIADELDYFRIGGPEGVWFLCNPVTGNYAINDRKVQSRRSHQNVTAWRYLVLESDDADAMQWLAALAQMPLPISAIYTSGGKSIHALIRLDAGSKGRWDAHAAKLKPALITLGADPKAISAVRLTRLPCCERLGTTDSAGNYVRYQEPRLQKLLYLNSAPDGTPICAQEVVR